MRKTTQRLLAGVASSVLALTLCTASAQAESPVLEVTLAGHDFVLNPATGRWEGTLTLTVNGTDYYGVGEWWVTDLMVNKNSYHWFGSGVYDFGELGSFEIWETGKWKLAEPNSGLSAMNQVLDGTGAFEGVHGVLHFPVYAHDGTKVNFIASGHLYFSPNSGE
jgi:hypothetical protein